MLGCRDKQVKTKVAAGCEAALHTKAFPISLAPYILVCAFSFKSAGMLIVCFNNTQVPINILK